MKNFPLPGADDPPQESRFVLDTSGHGSTDANHYDLMVRSNGADAKSEPPEEDPTRKRFQEDTKDLLDEELPDVPVEGFGAAILAGYGWSEGKGIGRSSKEDAKVFEYKRRAGTEGFGYEIQLVLNSKSSSVKRSQKEELPVSHQLMLRLLKMLLGTNARLRVEIGRAEGRRRGAGTEGGKHWGGVSVVEMRTPNQLRIPMVGGLIIGEKSHV